VGQTQRGLQAVNDGEVIADFDQPPPRKVCPKGVAPRPKARNSLKSISAEWGCVGIIVGAFLLLALVPAISRDALIAVTIFLIILVLLALALAACGFVRVVYYRFLVRYGEAVVGQVKIVTSIYSYEEPNRAYLVYQFHTRSGKQLTEKRELASDSDVEFAIGQSLVVVFLPHWPSINDPYDLLPYRICG
jgi:hypothetical protein